MTQINNVDVTDRHNRPGVLERVMLRTLFFNNGTLFDPADVSSVTIFSKTRNTSPSAVLDASSGLITDAAASAALMRFSPSGSVEAEALYVEGAANASSIFKLGTGDYAVILDGVNDISGVTRSGTAIANQVSAVKDYIDVWTVRLVAGSTFQTYINEFTLFSDSFMAVTERLLLTTRNKLKNKVVVLGSTEDIKVTTEVTVDNKSLDLATKNIFRDTAIVSGQLQIQKVNDSDSNLPAWTTVSAFGDTSSTVEVTSDNTLIWTFDTSILSGGAITNLGSAQGTYSAQVKYTLLAETIVSPLMYFKVI